MSYVNDPCDRCGSKRLSTKSHTEVIETFSGKQKITVSEIKCSNKTCQKAFEESFAAAKKITEERKQKKEEQDIVRKNNIRLSRKNAVQN
jgi:GTP cyclohydrolase III